MKIWPAIICSYFHLFIFKIVESYFSKENTKSSQQSGTKDQEWQVESLKTLKIKFTRREGICTQQAKYYNEQKDGRSGRLFAQKSMSWKIKKGKLSQNMFKKNSKQMLK